MGLHHREPRPKQVMSYDFTLAVVGKIQGKAAYGEATRSMGLSALIGRGS
ncbi:hypothetical protein WMF04_12455 [Sorangium sp. So ce260]